MTIKMDYNRQDIDVAMVEINFPDIVSGVAAPAINMPPGAIVMGGDVTVITPFNSATSDVIAVGDTASATRYLTGANIHAIGRVAAVPTGYVSQGEDITVTWTGVGAAPTAGKVRLTVQYVIQGRSESTFG